MPIKVDDPRDIQSAYDDRLTPQALHQAETQPDGSHDNIPDYDRANDGLDAYEKDFDASKTLDEAEGNTSGGWSTNVQGATNDAKSVVDKIKKMNFKRAAPIGGVVGLLIAVAGLISFFGGPGLLIVNLAEVMTEKFNYQLGSIDVRSKQILKAKLNNTTTGACSGVVSIRCKYTTFSDREIENFKKAGLTPELDGKSVLGRNKIKGFTLDDGKTTVSARQFASEMETNTKFSNAVKDAYRIKYSSMSDSIFSKVSKTLGISKKAPFEEGSDDKKRATTVEETTKKGKASIDAASNVECNNQDSCSAAENAQKTAAEDTSGNKLVDNSSNSATNVADEVISENSDLIEKGVAKEVTGTATKSITSIVKISGVFDNACMVYGWVKTISFTAKTVRALQMARYAMIFLTTASMIKAGDAKPEDVSYLGNVLTKVTVNSKNETSKAATDSFGYRYAAFGDSGINTTASTAVAGANFGSKIQGVVDKALSVLGGKDNADHVCHFLANPFVQAGSLVVGVASFLVGIGEAKVTAQAVVAPLIAIAGAILPAMIGDLLAGRLVDKNTYGERSGNLITSGSGGLLSKVAGHGGNSILKRADAISYMQLQRETELSYAQYERSKTSPFDATNPNTFLGSIYTSFVPYVYSSQSPLGALGSVVSLMSSTASNLLVPRSFAKAQETYGECSDPSYRELDMATDPFCNPVMGIPPKYLGDDPNTINDRLLALNAIDPTTGEPTDTTSIDLGGGSTASYQDFVSKCIDRETPFGSSEADQVDDSKLCFIDTQTKADMYVHYIDQRANNIGENGVDQASTNTSSSTSSTASGAGTSVQDDVPAKWKAIADGCKGSGTSRCTNGAWLGMLPGQCAAFAAWRVAQQWYGSKLNADGSNLEALVNSNPIIPNHTLNFGNGNAVAGLLISSGIADRVASLSETQPGDIVSVSPNHVFVITGNSGGKITAEDYNYTAPSTYGTHVIGENGYYTQSKVIAIARVHKNGGAN